MVYSQGFREPLQILEQGSDMARCIFRRNNSRQLEDLAWSQEGQVCGYGRAECALNQDSGCRRRWDGTQRYSEEMIHFPAFFGAGCGLMTKFWPIPAPYGFEGF